jgi:hypothetical protein
LATTRAAFLPLATALPLTVTLPLAATRTVALPSAASLPLAATLSLTSALAWESSLLSHSFHFLFTFFRSHILESLSHGLHLFTLFRRHILETLPHPLFSITGRRILRSTLAWRSLSRSTLSGSIGFLELLIDPFLHGVCFDIIGVERSGPLCA